MFGLSSFLSFNFDRAGLTGSNLGDRLVLNWHPVIVNIADMLSDHLFWLGDRCRYFDLQNTMQKCCTILSVSHLLLISLTTLVAAFVVESIIGTGSACMAVALIAFISSLFAKRFWLTATSLSTLAVGVFFIIYGLVFKGFGGPQNAALPLCVLFLVVQAFSIFATLADLNQRQRSSYVMRSQISLRQLLIASAIVALSFGVMENFPTGKVPYIADWSVALHYSWLVSLTLAMFFLSICGLISVWISLRGLNTQTAR